MNDTPEWLLRASGRWPAEVIYTPEELRQRIAAAVSNCELAKLDSECLVARKTMAQLRPVDGRT